MEALFALFVLGSSGWAAWQGLKWARRRLQTAGIGRRTARQQQAAAYQRQAEQQRRALAEQQKQKRLSYYLQRSLLELDRADDFRRAASWAQQAGSLPVAFRQRQFRRFRQKMVAFLARRLGAGGDEAMLMESLSELLEGLGVAAFEADYMLTEARRRHPHRSTPAPNYREQLQTWQRDHQQRVEAIREIPDQELRETLLEAENTRYRNQLLSQSEEDGAGTMPI